MSDNATKPRDYICETCDQSGIVRWIEAECCARPHSNGECCGDPDEVECHDQCPECNTDLLQKKNSSLQKELDEVKAELMQFHHQNLSPREQKLEAENKRLREALRFYADFKTWHNDLFLCGSEELRQDLEETSYSRFTPGKKAREALKKEGRE